MTTIETMSKRFSDLEGALEVHKQAMGEAEKLVRPHRNKARATAADITREIGAFLSTEGEKARLVAIIKNAVASAAAEVKPIAATVIQQYLTVCISNPRALAGDGKLIIDTLFSFDGSGIPHLPEPQRRLALLAVLVAASGGSPLGMIRWPEDWSAGLSLHHLRPMALLADEKAYSENISNENEARNILDKATHHVEHLSKLEAE